MEYPLNFDMKSEFIDLTLYDSWYIVIWHFGNEVYLLMSIAKNIWCAYFFDIIIYNNKALLFNYNQTIFTSHCNFLIQAIPIKYAMISYNF